MKKQLLILILLPLTFFAAAQSLNGGFESQRSGEKPHHWGSITLLSVPIDSAITCKKDSDFYFSSTDAHSGHFALEMRNAECDGIYIGTAHLMEVDSNYFDLGIPLSERPAFFTFWYKYTSVGNDSAYASIQLVNYNHGNTLFSGKVKLPAASVYTPVSIPLNYLGADTPDRLEITFATEENRINAHFGSRLLVDDVEMRNWPLTANTSAKQTVTVYPDPARDQVIFNTGNTENSMILIYSFDGKEIYSGNTSGPFIYNCSDLTPGIYSFKILSGSGRIASGKFIKI